MIDLSDYLSLGDKWLYDILSEHKQDIFPPGYSLDILYTHDQFNNDQAVGKSLLRLQEYLAIVNIPNFFVKIHTNKLNIAEDLSNIKNIFTPSDVELSYQIIPGTFNKELVNNDSMCVLPWVHLFIDPQGRIGNCCQFNEYYPLGHVSQDKLIDVVNNDKMKTVRRQMMSGQRPNTCSNCWLQEDHNIISARQTANLDFKHYLPLIEQTLPDGTFDDFKLRTIDFRASNVCNLKCRMCSGRYSSRLAQEEIELYPELDSAHNFIELKLDTSSTKNVLEFIEKNINDLESIYFAGGEPLVMAEHYKILDLLILHNRTDVNLTYNTNLSILKYKKLSILDYWKQFSDVAVLASIDLIGKRAEYVRSGVDYDVLETNYQTIKDYVSFKIDSTLTVYNSFNLMALQRRWIEDLGLSPDDFNIRIAMFPPKIMCCSVLPWPIKELVIRDINNHIAWLSTFNNPDSLVTQWKEVLQFINSDDQSHLLGEFLRVNDDKDRIRNEKFEDVFPEFQTLRSYV